MISAPNQSTPGNRKANSNGTLAGGASPVNPPNSPDNRKSGTMPLGGGSSPVNPPNNGPAVFQVGTSRMAQPPAATPMKSPVTKK
jgi:hypothetical protein